MVIYIAGPYSAPTRGKVLDNCDAANEAVWRLLRKGHMPLCPHFNHQFEEWAQATHGYSIPYEQYMDWDFALLERCDAVLLLQSSPGADREVAVALLAGLDIFYKVEDVPNADTEEE